MLMPCNDLPPNAKLGTALAGRAWRTNTVLSRYHSKGLKSRCGLNADDLDTEPKWEYFVGVLGCAEESAMTRKYAAVFAVVFSAAALVAQSPDQQSKSTIVTGNSAAAGSAGWQTEPPASFGVTCMQKSSGQPVQPCTFPLPILSACPVSLRAGHLADGSFVKTDGAHPKGIGQWLSLSLSVPDRKSIVRATLVVRGLTPRAHVSQALSADGPSPHAVRTFHVSFSPGPNQSSLADLWVSGMSAVERIDLLNVDYGDGSTWKVADGQSCRVEPDMKMLITSR